jgi:hypothetical protein
MSHLNTPPDKHCPTMKATPRPLPGSLERDTSLEDGTVSLLNDLKTFKKCIYQDFSEY